MTHLVRRTTKKMSYHRITTGCTLMDQLGRTTQLPRPQIATELHQTQATEHQRRAMGLQSPPLLPLSRPLVATVTLRLISCQSISSQRSHSVSTERQTFLVSNRSSPTTGCPRTRTPLRAPSLGGSGKPATTRCARPDLR